MVGLVHETEPHCILTGSGKGAESAWHVRESQGMHKTVSSASSVRRKSHSV